MRQLVAFLAVLASPAVADRPDKHKPIDIADGIDKLDVFRDEVGKFYVIPKHSSGQKISDIAAKWTFFGDGRSMYQQRVDSSSTAGGNMSFGLWSPRVRGGMVNALIEVKKEGVTTLTCRMVKSKYEVKALTRLADDDARKLLTNAKFYPPYWEHQVFFFGRGESTTYYLVDQFRKEYGGAGHRLYIGRKGQMKAHAIVDFAADTGGTLIVTKAGTLEIKSDRATWRVGKKTIEITTLPAAENRYLVYRELGVYGQLGTVCEDQ